MKVEIYSDVACPWCYIGKARFERALAAFAGRDGVEVVYRPYQLDPDAPRTGVPMLRNLEQRFGGAVRGMVDRVAETARQEGLEIDYEHGLAANTFDAHRVMWLAERKHGPAVQRELAERLFRAHFAEGKDVNDRDVLASLAAESGMDAERVRALLASAEGVGEVRQAIAEAHARGVTAVPTFVFDDLYAVQGAQPAAILQQALEHVAAERGAVDAAGGAAACADDSCET